MRRFCWLTIQIQIQIKHVKNLPYFVHVQHEISFCMATRQTQHYVKLTINEKVILCIFIMLKYWQIGLAN